jgi:hypothetical protein
MLVHGEHDGMFDYRNAAVAKIREAFAMMLNRRRKEPSVFGRFAVRAPSFPTY